MAVAWSTLLPGDERVACSFGIAESAWGCRLACNGAQSTAWELGNVIVGPK